MFLDSFWELWLPGILQQFAISEATLLAWSSMDGESPRSGSNQGSVAHLSEVNQESITSRGRRGNGVMTPVTCFFFVPTMSCLYVLTYGPVHVSSCVLLQYVVVTMVH